MIETHSKNLDALAADGLAGGKEAHGGDDVAGFHHDVNN